MRGPHMALLGLAAMALGCIPLHPTVREARTGTVLDAATGRPVAGATVRVESFQVPIPPGRWGVKMVRSIEVKTDADGRWSVPSEHEWTIGILAADGLPFFADVYCALVDGFQREARTAHRGWLPRSSSVDEMPSGEERSELRLARSIASSQLPEQAGSMTTCGVALGGDDAVQPGIAADRASPGR
jgi:hypothetical protein